MIKFLTIAVATAFSAPALAAPAANTGEVTFTRDRITYHVREQDMGAYRLLSGRDSTGREFNIRVAGDFVTGEYGGDSVEFWAPKERAAEQVASR